MSIISSLFFAHIVYCIQIFFPSFFCLYRYLFHICFHKWACFVCVCASATLIRLKFKPELEDMIINTIFIYIHRVNEKHIPLTTANRIDYSFVDVIIFFSVFILFWHNSLSICDYLWLSLLNLTCNSLWLSYKLQFQRCRTKEAKKKQITHLKNYRNVSLQAYLLRYGRYEGHPRFVTSNTW